MGGSGQGQGGGERRGGGGGQVNKVDSCLPVSSEAMVNRPVNLATRCWLVGWLLNVPVTC